jgi:3-hydroxyacyl-CoA dehydrogenase
MASQLALLFLRRLEVPVVLTDIDQERVDKGVGYVHAEIEKLLGKGRINQDKANRLKALVSGVLDKAEGFSDADFIIEAVFEEIGVKQQVFAEVEAVAPAHAILATNTSSLSVTEMGEATTRPDKVCGFHFFYPASMMRLIEVIEGDETSDETLQTAANFAQALRKTAVRCGEVPGFVVNRILTSAMSEVWRVTEEEELDTKEVDKAIQESGTVPMGPYYLTDLLGLDTVLHVAEHLRDSYGGDRFYVSTRMQELVAAGNLGQKTGKGFYEHG